VLKCLSQPATQCPGAHLKQLVRCFRKEGYPVNDEDKARLAPLREAKRSVYVDVICTKQHNNAMIRNADREQETKSHPKGSTSTRTPTCL
jgi:hypothetical protein